MSCTQMSGEKRTCIPSNTSRSEVISSPSVLENIAVFIMFPSGLKTAIISPSFVLNNAVKTRPYPFFRMSGWKTKGASITRDPSCSDKLKITAFLEGLPKEIEKAVLSSISEILIFDGRKRSFSPGKSKRSNGSDVNRVPVHLNTTNQGTFLSVSIDGADIIAINSGFGSSLILAITASTTAADRSPLG